MGLTGRRRLIRAVLVAEAFAAGPLAAPAHAAIEGVVFSSDGDPLAGVKVFAYAPEASRERLARLVEGRARSADASGETAADGSFRLATTLAVADVQLERDGYAPNALAIADGSRVTVALRPFRPRLGVVTGGGAPVAGARIAWIAERDPLEVVVRSASDGTFTLPDPGAATGMLLILHADFAPEVSSPEQDLVSTHGVDSARGRPVRHRLDAGTALEVSVVDEAGVGVAEADVFVDGWPVGRTTAAGRLRVAHVKAGWTRVSAEAAGLVGSSGAGDRVLVRLHRAHRLEGLVRDSGSGQALAGTSVSLTGDPLEAALVTIADAAGRYRFDRLPPGRYRVSARRAGYEGDDGGLGVDDLGGSGAAGAVDLRATPSARSDLVLTRLTEVEGRVSDERGQPVGGASVSLWMAGVPRTYSLGSVGPEWWPHARSAPDGSFSLAARSGLPAELEWSLVASKPGFAMGVLEHVSPSARQPLEIVLPSGVPLAGQVVTADGAPVAAAAVSVLERADGGMREALFSNADVLGWTRSDGAGRFQTRVRPLAHTLRFHKPGLSPKLVSVRSAELAQELSVVLEPTVRISGTVLRHDGTPESEVAVLARSRMGLQSAVTSADGSFVLADLAPGAYELRVLREELDLGVSKSVEAPASQVRISLEQRGTIRGRVLDARSHTALATFTVHAETAGADSSYRPGQLLDPASGLFEIRELPLGEAKVAVDAPGFVPQLVPGVPVSGGDDEPVLISLEPGASFRGRVTSEDGRPLADVTVMTERTASATRSAETDERGEYELSGIAPGRVALLFRKPGFLPLRKAVSAAEAARLDVVLSRGLAASGVVLEDGVGVAKASVSASSSSAGSEGVYARTDERGRFTLEGLAPGRYTVSARGPSGGEDELADLDIESAGSLRLSLHRAPSAVLVGTVVGLDSLEDLAMIRVEAEGESASSSASVDSATGRFRMERAPVGRIRVSASAVSLEGASRASRVQELVLEPGGETQTVVEFAEGVSVSGRITSDGHPLVRGAIAFRSPDGRREAGSPTDAAGQYRVVGLEPGLYAVSVSGANASFERRYEVAGDMQLDIDASGSRVEGRAIDAASGAGLAGARVSLWSTWADGNSPATSTSAGANDAFELRASDEGRYRLVASHDGYGQTVAEVELRPAETQTVELALQASEGLTIEVVDARDGIPLDATVVVRDAGRRIVANEHSGVGPDGTLTVPLAPGAYLLSTSASGYGTRTLPVTAPGSGLRVPLTPGGSLVVESDRDLRGSLRLVGEDGEEYVRCWCNGIASIDLEGRRTLVEHVTAGSYTGHVLDGAGQPLAAPFSVTIVDGQRSAVRVD